jgi:restriction system protein
LPLASILRQPLTDGQQLAELMIEFNVGVTQIDTYEVKRIDSDYFSEE